MSRTFLSDLADGQSVDEVFLLADKQLRANRHGQQYLLTQLRDRTGVMSGLLWNVDDTDVAGFSTGDYVKIRGRVQLYQGSLQVILTRIEYATDSLLDPADFRPQPAADAAEHRERLETILRGIETTPLREVVESFLSDDELMDGFCRAPAGIKAHHAYEGGLLEHVVNMLETAALIRPRYPAIDFDLLFVGVFLHDLGKVRELEYDDVFAYSDEGQLLGHMSIAVEILSDKIRETERRTGEVFPAETTLRLKHMILSHHGRYEFGSSKLPMTPEAVALYHLDNLDAKVHEFSRSIEDDPNADSHWTPYSPRLERKLFKGGGE